MMKRKSTLLVLLAAVVLGIVATGAHGTSGGYTGMTKANLTIHHAVVGCHTWTLNGNANVDHHIVIRAGRSFTLRNHDNCPQTLVQTSGPKDVMMSSEISGALRDGTLGSAQEPLRVNLFTPGTYAFTTEEGVVEPDHALTGFDRMPSYGPDNHLTLTVTVLPLAKADE